MASAPTAAPCPCSPFWRMLILSPHLDKGPKKVQNLPVDRPASRFFSRGLATMEMRLTLQINVYIHVL
jgi:hypothetical protein